MLSRALNKGYSVKRLRQLLAIFFMVLTIPTTFLIWQTYGQLKWESFHQYRGAAEELSRRIDSGLMDVVRNADARSFADYSFLVVSGNPRANFLQQSPLSSYPVAMDVPGTIGYFQVDTNGVFSTPLLPSDGSNIEKLGITPEEHANRYQLSRDIHAILADNHLVSARPEAGRRQLPAAKTAEVAAFAEKPAQDADAFQGEVQLRQTALERELAPEPPVTDVLGATGTVENEAENEADKASRSLLVSAPAASSMPASVSAGKKRANDSEQGYTQGVFDTLKQARPASPAESEEGGKVLERNVYLKKSELAESEKKDLSTLNEVRSDAPARQLRKEKISVPEYVAANESSVDDGTALPADLTVRTFESEVDPFEFSMLDSGHFVLFRKVWRDGERFIQGILIDQTVFMQDLLQRRFIETSLASMSSLQVTYQGTGIWALDGGRYGRYSSRNDDLDGTLLYMQKLSAPLDGMDLLFRVNNLPPGPGASVLGWLTLVIAIVFTGSFLVLYRLGLSQISLARQQQDFVSAVSHELKTPLTSIRMYSEMLKEGWATEEKRHGYYEYIHDESERLSRLISNVLQLARITRSEPQFDMKPITVGELMSQVESKISNQVERAGFDLQKAVDDHSIGRTILVDADCFMQIIINLVDNAIKFSKNAELKRITIGTELAGERGVSFSVRDCGPGIPSDQLKKIFTLFYRSESELTRETVGTGIGLAIVHQLTVAMGGKVEVVNRKPGVEFSIVFPFAP